MKSHCCPGGKGKIEVKVPEFEQSDPFDFIIIFIYE
jgi:hypothetical protein